MYRERTPAWQTVGAHLSDYEYELPEQYAHGRQWRAIRKGAEEAIGKLQTSWRYKRADRRGDDRKKRELEAAAINRTCGRDARRLPFSSASRPSSKTGSSNSSGRGSERESERARERESENTPSTGRPCTRGADDSFRGCRRQAALTTSPNDHERTRNHAPPPGDPARQGAQRGSGRAGTIDLSCDPDPYPSPPVPRPSRLRPIGRIGKNRYARFRERRPCGVPQAVPLHDDVADPCLRWRGAERTQETANRPTTYRAAVEPETRPRGAAVSLDHLPTIEVDAPNVDVAARVALSHHIDSWPTPSPAGTSFRLIVITPPPYALKVPYHDVDDDAEMRHVIAEHWPTATAVHRPPVRPEQAVSPHEAKPHQRPPSGTPLSDDAVRDPTPRCAVMGHPRRFCQEMRDLPA